MAEPSDAERAGRRQGQLDYLRRREAITRAEEYEAMRGVENDEPWDKGSTKPLWRD